MGTDRYQSPLCGRYASVEMQQLFSDDWKFATWRRMWYVLAQVLQRLGLHITNAQLAEMAAHINSPIDYARVATLERVKRHDVMAHATAFGEVCPMAAPIIHLGATSCDITDNTELVQMRQAIDLVLVALARTIARMAQFAQQHRDLPTLGSTHYQAAALTTVGKRTCMWLQNLLIDFQELRRLRAILPFRGIKGATGTQDSFLTLFEGDHTKVVALDRLFTEAFEFNHALTITGQTYTRKLDTLVMNGLQGVGLSVHKLGTDIRLLAHDGEIKEPLAPGQIGSSAMPWKDNPMRDERGCSLGRLPIGYSLLAQITEAVQWLERTLDDSAGRRVYVPESFLAVDACLRIVQNVFEGMRVFPKVIQRRLEAQLPFIAMERMMMAMVREHAVNRQECHERLRQHARAAALVIEQDGGNNDLLDRIRDDEYFAPIHGDLDNLLQSTSFIGRAPQQVDQFLAEEVAPALEPYREALEGEAELTV